jgi:serine-type D-Ala-D-Ala carboxypeptidase/endopeptidase (penicillin-binding protein 4)
MRNSTLSERLSTTIGRRSSCRLFDQVATCAQSCSTAATFVLLGAVIVGLGLPSFAAAQEPALAETIDRLLEHKHLRASRVGVYVVDTDSGDVLYSRNEDTLFNPASNMKLFTAAAALETFAVGHVFQTRLALNRRSGDEVDGPLFVQGHGDPGIFFDDLLNWAVKVKEQGIRRITGDIVIDDGAFRAGYTAPGFDQKNEDGAYRAPIGAVSANFNMTTVTVSPGDKAGSMANVMVFPPNANVEVKNSAKTTTGKTCRASVASQPKGDKTEIVVGGTLGHLCGPVVRRKRIVVPWAYFGALFHEALGTVGVEVKGTVRRGETPVSAVTLFETPSASVAHQVTLMNKWSNNFIAEELFQQIGHVGLAADADESAAVSAARSTIRALSQSASPSTDGATVYNGSGLYDGNLVSPRAIVDLLVHMATHRSGPEFVSSLAIGGVDGTLRSRLDSKLVRGRVRAKTGTLNQVLALSGYVRSRSGRNLAFSILFNRTPVRAWRLRSNQDQIVEAILQTVP